MPPGYSAAMAQEPASGAPAPGTAAHPVVDEDTTPASDEIPGGPAADVAATGTALHEGERTSDLDLDEAPGTAGPGAG